MTLTVEQQRLRDGKVTASFAPSLMAGDETKIMSEWCRLVGSPDYEAQDLSGSWPVQFGSWIEPFALDWHQAKTGQALSRRSEVVTHPAMPYVCCTLDAFREDDSCVIDCKAPGMWRKLDDVRAQYAPQMVVQRACVGAERAALLIVHGGSEPVECPIEWDAEYEAAVWERIAWFWSCVESLTHPIAVTPIAAPVQAVREVDMGASNSWCAQAGAWLAHRDAAKTFTVAEKDLKALVEPDVKRAFGAGIECKRAKNGAITIREAMS